MNAEKPRAYIIEFNTNGTITYLSNCVAYSARTSEQKYAREFKFKNAANCELRRLDFEDPFREWTGKVLPI